ncbi:unnamed protein product [Adineta ricciae]|uniref:Cyclic nucleotide-binding domain-containing protein n=1 Tax=Adineta ricciae TaxID=249248 RepID=A0A813N8V5_ADIRI|nr:unnamed protein product [Adineta ricciae]
MLIASPVISSTVPSEKKKNELFPQCTRAKQVAYPFSSLRTSQSVVDYEELKRLQALSNEPEDREETHYLFMKQYVSVLKPPPPRRTWTSRNKSTGAKTTETLPLPPVENQSSLLNRSVGRAGKDITPFQRDIKILRQLIRKLQIQRTNAENDQIFQIMSQFPEFMALDPRAEILREAIELAHLEICYEANQPVLPTNGYFFILKGGITTLPPSSQLPPLSSPPSIQTLTIGQSFGSLIATPESKYKTWVITTDERTEFLKINKDEFITVKKKFEQTEYLEKYSLVISCGEYKTWSKQTVDEFLHLIEWINYPPNTIIASEGFRCPFIAFLKVGECHVLRKVDVVKLEQNGTKGRQLRQVVMGKITAPDSFGEISVILQEAMTCTIVTATHCWLGIIRPEKVLELPDLTRQLILQIAKRTFGHLSQDDIHHEYVSQETRKEWTDFKNDMVEHIMSKKKPLFGRGK